MDLASKNLGLQLSGCPLPAGEALIEIKLFQPKSARFQLESTKASINIKNRFGHHQGLLTMSSSDSGSSLPRGKFQSSRLLLQPLRRLGMCTRAPCSLSSACGAIVRVLLLCRSQAAGWSLMILRLFLGRRVSCTTVACSRHEHNVATSRSPGRLH